MQQGGRNLFIKDRKKQETIIEKLHFITTRPFDCNIDQKQTKINMAFRSTSAKLMAGVSRSKNFRLTLEQLRIYKKVGVEYATCHCRRCKQHIWAVHTWFDCSRCDIILFWSVHESSHFFLPLVSPDVHFITATDPCIATKNESKPVCRCHDEINQRPGGLGCKSLFWSTRIIFSMLPYLNWHT